MTIKVVGQDKPRKITCRDCGAILEYEKRDVERKTIQDYGGGSDEVEFIRCPQCKARVDIRSW